MTLGAIIRLLPYVHLPSLGGRTIKKRDYMLKKWDNNDSNILYCHFQRVLSDWSATFFTIFKLVPQKLGDSNASILKPDKLVSIDEYLDGYLMERRNRYGKKLEVLELGMQEIRTYFRLFLLSSVLLLFMFCSRISKSKFRPIVSAIPL